MDDRPQRPGPQVQAASLTGATASLVLWASERWVFHGEVPAEVTLWVMLVIPWLSARLAAEIAYRRCRRRLDVPPGG